MKKLVNVVEVDGEGFNALLGEDVLIFCMNYIYTGKLVGVNDTCILLDNASIVYETGPLDSRQFRDSQKLPNSWYIATNSIESFGKKA